MTKSQTEEQFPLLLVLVGDQDVSQNNKRLFGRGRFDGITSGASAIITEWPNYLSSCWLTALICGFTLFAVSIILTSCLTYQPHPRLPRCFSDHQIVDNKTIHLIHSSNKWSTHQIELFKNIANTYPNYLIHLMLVNNNEEDTKANKTKRQSNNTDNKTDQSLNDLIYQNPNIIVTNISYQDIFEKSPLVSNWMSFSDQMKLFAARVLQIWEFGGLSYDLLDHKLPPLKKYKNCTGYSEIKLKNYIRRGFDRYEKLSPSVVSVDHNGYHMESKTPCHAFFGKVLMKLKKANERTTPRGVLNGPMFTFCRNGILDKEFCHVKSFFSQ